MCLPVTPPTPCVTVIHHENGEVRFAKLFIVHVPQCVRKVEYSRNDVV